MNSENIYPFIKLTNEDGNILYVLSLDITGIQSNSDNTTWLACGNRNYVVKETPEQILTLISGCEEEIDAC